MREAYVSDSAFLSHTGRGRNPSSHYQGVTAIVAAAWPNAQPLLQPGKSKDENIGARPSEAPPRSYRLLSFI